MALVSLTTYVVYILYISGGICSLNSIPNDEFLRSSSWQFYITRKVFAAEKMFLHTSYCSGCLTCGLNSGLTSNNWFWLNVWLVVMNNNWEYKEQKRRVDFAVKDYLKKPEKSWYEIWKQFFQNLRWFPVSLWESHKINTLLNRLIFFLHNNNRKYFDLQLFLIVKFKTSWEHIHACRTYL